MKPHEFWDLTYAEFICIYKGYLKAQRRKNNELLYLAYHAALFERQKVLPALDSILIDETIDPTERKSQTPQDMETMARMLNAMFGGNEVID